jgi:hypothetical protein
MLATLLGAIRADIDRQVGWARGEVGRQLRYTALTGALAAFAPSMIPLASRSREALEPISG